VEGILVHGRQPSLGGEEPCFAHEDGGRGRGALSLRLREGRGQGDPRSQPTERLDVGGIPERFQDAHQERLNRTDAGEIALEPGGLALKASEARLGEEDPGLLGGSTRLRNGRGAAGLLPLGKKGGQSLGEKRREGDGGQCNRVTLAAVGGRKDDVQSREAVGRVATVSVGDPVPDPHVDLHVSSDDYPAQNEKRAPKIGPPATPPAARVDHLYRPAVSGLQQPSGGPPLPQPRDEGLRQACAHQL
jgi:hypothetical protein